MGYYLIKTAKQTNNQNTENKMSDNQIINKLNNKIEELKNEYRQTYGEQNLNNLRNQIESLKAQRDNVMAFAHSS